MTGDDKELLTYAAKAAGITIDKTFGNGGGSRNTGFDLAGDAVLDWHNSKVWNPLTDDGDAFRLMAKLNLWEAGRYARIEMGQPGYEDEYSSMRRCIVRAAARIGKAMP